MIPAMKRSSANLLKFIHPSAMMPQSCCLYQTLFFLRGLTMTMSNLFDAITKNKLICLSSVCVSKMLNFYHYSPEVTLNRFLYISISVEFGLIQSTFDFCCKMTCFLIIDVVGLCFMAFQYLLVI